MMGRALKEDHRSPRTCQCAAHPEPHRAGVDSCLNVFGDGYHPNTFRKIEWWEELPEERRRLRSLGRIELRWAANFMRKVAWGVGLASLAALWWWNVSATFLVIVLAVGWALDGIQSKKREHQWDAEDQEDEQQALADAELHYRLDAASGNVCTCRMCQSRPPPRATRSL